MALAHSSVAEGPLLQRMCQLSFVVLDTFPIMRWDFLQVHNTWIRMFAMCLHVGDCAAIFSFHFVRMMIYIGTSKAKFRLCILWKLRTPSDMCTALVKTVVSQSFGTKVKPIPKSDKSKQKRPRYSWSCCCYCSRWWLFRVHRCSRPCTGSGNHDGSGFSKMENQAVNMNIFEN